MNSGMSTVDHLNKALAKTIVYGEGITNVEIDGYGISLEKTNKGADVHLILPQSLVTTFTPISVVFYKVIPGEKHQKVSRLLFTTFYDHLKLPHLVEGTYRITCSETLKFS